MNRKLNPISLESILALFILLLTLSTGVAVTATPQLTDFSTLQNYSYLIGLWVMESCFHASSDSPTFIVGLGLTVMVFIILVLIAGTILLWTLSRRDTNDFRHLAGPRLLEYDAAIKDASKKLKREHGKASLKIHPRLTFTEQLFQGNIFVTGQQGGGKSTFIKPLAHQIYEANDFSFTYDEKGEYHGICQSKSITHLALTPNSEFIWDIGKDIKTENDAGLVAQALLGNSNDNERFFTDAAQQILKYVIVYLYETKTDWSWKDLYDSLFCSDNSLKLILAKTSPSSAILIETNSKTTHSIRSVLSTRLHWLKEMSALQRTSKSYWSISQLVNRTGKAQHVFFEPNTCSPDLSRYVCNALVTLIIERWLAQKDSQTNKLWLIIDELGNLPKNPSILRWLTLSRSKGGRLIAGTQSYSQLYDAYGENSSETMLSLFRTVVVMRLGASGESAQKASELFGKQRVMTLNQSISHDKKQTISTQYHDRAVVTREDIINLPSSDKHGVVGYLMIGGLVNVYKLKWPHYVYNPKTLRSVETARQRNSKDFPQKKSVNKLNRRTKVKTGGAS